MENPTKQSFAIIIKILKIVRWYPTENKSKLYLVQAYSLYFLILVVGNVLVAVQMLVKKGYDDIMQIIYISETMCYSFKVLPFLGGNERIKKCIGYFDGDEFQPQDETEKKILDKSVFICQMMSKFYIVGISCSEVFYAIPALLSDGPELPLPIWLPFPLTSRSTIYYIIYFYLYIGVVYSSFATCLLDPLIGGLVFQAVTHLRILKHRIQNPRNLIEDRSVKTLLQTDIYQKVAACVVRHNAILKFVKEYEECFSWTIFNQFLGTATVICFLCVAIVTVPLASVDSIKYICFFFMVNWQILFYCYFGNALYEESDTLVTAIYLSQWYEYPVEAQKLLVTLMERSQQPIILRAEKLLDLTLNTFTAMLKKSYSFVAVLK
ncbi:hypothetical protein Zmor_002362 [Zophobas morio]|uniref:Odorant receptor n=2 Tax=Zophobas morio TaxID=2755281 RepID=A0AA38JA20_9CUCU|nr:hypothetical protein Zmor_002362 [Zophobas morio]